MTMNELIKQCCGENGVPDFEKMKQFMGCCRKADFSDEEIERMKQFCGQDEEPDFEQMKRFMERCGCRLPRSGRGGLSAIGGKRQPD